MIFAAYTAAAIHPDGLICAIGESSGIVRIWDIKSQATVQTFEGHEGAVSSICFSENGYHMATAAHDGSVRLWDLRKLQTIKTLQLEKDSAPVVSFDHSGSYIAIGSSAVRVLAVKPWLEVAVFNEHTDRVSGVAFGVDATTVFSVGMDRTLRVYGSA